MTDAEIATIAKLCDTLRSRGVRRCDIPGDISIEFDSSAPDNAAPSVAPAKPWCKCGHEEYQHMSGACVMGCAPDKCLMESADA